MNVSTGDCGALAAPSLKWFFARADENLADQTFVIVKDKMWCKSHLYSFTKNAVAGPAQRLDCFATQRDRGPDFSVLGSFGFAPRASGVLDRWRSFEFTHTTIIPFCPLRGNCPLSLGVCAGLPSPDLAEIGARGAMIELRCQGRAELVLVVVEPYFKLIEPIRLECDSGGHKDNSKNWSAGSAVKGASKTQAWP